MINKQNNHNVIYAIFWQEGLYRNPEQSRTFKTKEGAERWLQNVKHIPHSEVIEVTLRRSG